MLLRGLQIVVATAILAVATVFYSLNVGEKAPAYGAAAETAPPTPPTPQH